MHGSIRKAVLHTLIVKQLKVSFIQRLTGIFIFIFRSGEIKIYTEVVIFVSDNF